MSHYIDADKLKAEIERRIKILREDEIVRQNCTSDFLEGKIYGYEESISLLSSFESENPMNQKGLEREIERCLWQLSDDPSNEELCMFARHFAKWGAEHLANNNMVAVKLGDEIAVNGYKLVYDKNENAIKVAKVESSGNSEDLEEAAKKYQERIPVDTTIHYCGADEDVYFANHIVDAFIAGAKRDREQMMNEAVDATVHLEPGANPIVTIGVGRFGLKVRDKVKVIIVKED